MPSTVSEQIVDAVTGEEMKVFGTLPTLSASVSQQNQIAQQQRVNDMANSVLSNAMNASQQFGQLAAQQALQISANSAAIQQAMLGRVTRHILDLSGEQAAAFEKTLGAQLQDQLTELNASLAGGQQMAKIANTTPPETGVAQALSTLAAGQAAIIELLRGRSGA